MSGISISGIISDELLTQFSGSKGSAPGSTVQLSGSIGGVSDSSSVKLSLSRGASVFSRALNNLTTASSFVNISDDNLEKLLTLTNKLITTTEKAARGDIQDGERQELDATFKKLGTE